MSKINFLRCLRVFLTLLLFISIAFGCSKKDKEPTASLDNTTKGPNDNIDEQNNDGVKDPPPSGTGNFINLSSMASPVLLVPNYTENSLGEKAPGIIKISEGVGPGDAVSVYGEYLTGDLLVKLEEANREIIPVQTDPDGQFLRFIWPDDVTPGVYTLKVSNDGGKSWCTQERWLNAPDIQWAADAGTYTGMTMEIIGRCFDAAQYGGTSNTKVRLVNAETGELTEVVMPNMITPYRVSFVTPYVIPDVRYYIQINVGSAGRGSEWYTAVEYPFFEYETVTAVEAPVDATAIAMNVSWVSDFVWDNIYDIVKDYNADNTGTYDVSDLIAQAINDAYTAGGGVVYLPEGTYKAGPSKLKENVVLKGAGTDRTKIVFLMETDGNFSLETKWEERGLYWPKNWTSIFENADDNTKGRCGIAEITAELHPGLDPDLGVFIAQLKGENIFMFRINADLEPPLDGGPCFDRAFSAHVNFGGTGPILHAESNTKATTWDNMKSWELKGKHHIVRNNHITFSVDFFPLYSEKLFFVNNTIDAVLTKCNQWGWCHGLFPGQAYNQYIGENTITNQMLHNGWSEIIALDAALSMISSETVLDADESSVTIVRHYFNDHNINSYNWKLLIQSGTGLGQSKTVTGMEILGKHEDEELGQSFDIVKVLIDGKWDIVPVPGETTRLSVTANHKGIIIENNFGRDGCNVLVTLYGSCYDVVVSGNVGHHTYGINLLGTIVLGVEKGDDHIWNNNGGGSSYFNQIRDTYLYGTDKNVDFTNTHTGEPTWGQDPRRDYTGIGEYGGSIYQRVHGQDYDIPLNAWATALYGNEYRNNVVDKTPESKNRNDAGHLKTNYAYAVSSQNNGFETACSKAPLFDGNTAINAAGALDINYPSTFGAFVKDFIWSDNVDTELKDKGQNTFVYK